MKQIIIRVSKLDNPTGYSAKQLMQNYTELGAKKIINTINDQTHESMSDAIDMYGKQTLSMCKRLLEVAYMQDVDDGLVLGAHQLAEGGRL